MKQPLDGRVTIVAGATRGAGRGIARMLGEAGAIVYCTGRSARGNPSTGHHYSGRPETIEETAEMVDAAGGKGIAVRVDHTSEPEVAALFKRVRKEQKRLDVLVNVLTGPPAKWKSFVKLSLDDGRKTLDGWIWPHVVTCWHAASLMVPQKSGLIVEITEHDSLGYHGELFYDLAAMSVKRLAYDLAEELAPRGVTALAITPGFMRTEAILERFAATEATWREAAEKNAEAKSFGLIASETPCFLGRAVAALAADPDVARKSGGLFNSWGLAEEYGFTDVDGARPRWGSYFAKHFPQFASGTPRCGVLWKIAASESVPATARA